MFLVNKVMQRPVLFKLLHFLLSVICYMAKFMDSIVVNHQVQLQKAIGKKMILLHLCFPGILYWISLNIFNQEQDIKQCFI